MSVCLGRPDVTVENYVELMTNERSDGGGVREKPQLHSYTYSIAGCRQAALVLHVLVHAFMPESPERKLAPQRRTLVGYSCSETFCCARFSRAAYAHKQRTVRRWHVKR